MKIIGFNLTRIHAERNDQVKNNVSINQNIDIKDLVEENINMAGEKALRLSFNLVINYSDDLAVIELGGGVLIMPDTEERKKLLDAWKDKKIPEDLKIPLFNFVMNKCNIKALHIEDEMNLPLHVPMPRLTKDMAKKEDA